jgi:hypothetical protein
MKKVFYFIFAAIAAFVLWKIFTGHDEPVPAERFKPKDDRFAETVTETVKPNLLGQYKKQDFTIPKDINAKDIDQVITIFTRDTTTPSAPFAKGEPKKIDIVIDRQGRVFVENKLVDSVRIRKYEQAVFGFKQEIGIGASRSAGGRGYDASVSYAFFHAKKLKIPVAEFGLRSCGIGIQYPITGRLNAGVFAASDYKDLKRRFVKATVTINF